jgi:hypothetical protein
MRGSAERPLDGNAQRRRNRRAAPLENAHRDPPGLEAGLELEAQYRGRRFASRLRRPEGKREAGPALRRDREPA